MKTSQKTRSQETSHTLHEVLRQLPYGLYAIGVGTADKANAFAGSWVMQCSFDPPLLAVAVRKDASSGDRLRETEGFSVNLLRKDQDAIAREVVKPSHHTEDKLHGIAHTAGETGAPVFEETLASIECKVIRIDETGDHLLVIGEAVNARQNQQGEALVCADLGWHYAG